MSVCLQPVAVVKEKYLVMGEFNSEQYWRNPDWVKLPEIPDQSNRNIIFALDELLFLFCEATDVLITRFKFNDVLKSYLSSLGFDFIGNSRSIQQNLAEREESLFQIVADHPGRIWELASKLRVRRSLDPYSLVCCCDRLAQTLNLDFSGPDLETVKKVNSKVYSCRLSQKLDLPGGGAVVASGRELLEKGDDLLINGPFLLKDPYGVSGKGNVLIQSVKILERLVKYIEGQARNGLTVCFVIEPFLDKIKDFSCSFTIDQTGRAELVSVQEMINRNFAYCGSVAADPAFIEWLDREKYFDVIEKIAGNLYQEGYFGPVCVDSMVLTSGVIVPIVEINARKSMGFFNHRINRYLSRFGLMGNLLFLNVGYRRELRFEQVMAAFDAARLLFTPEKECGVMLLSANTLLANREFSQYANPAVNGRQTIYQGRIYFSVIARAPDHRRRKCLSQAVRSLFQAMACTVYN
jgi:hypothetical protein